MSKFVPQNYVKPSAKHTVAYCPDKGFVLLSRVPLGGRIVYAVGARALANIVMRSNKLVLAVRHPVSKDRFFLVSML